MACTVAATAVLSLGVGAQIRTDTSLGKPAQTLSGPGYQIPESLGKLSGSNLFHSFQVFNINTGESANFSTSSAGITNVISRVTGGTQSQINGLLTLTTSGSTPSFYLVNPAGVTFGTGAAVNVPGAFYVSTADYVKFPDGNFYADTAATSTFSTVSPTAFGFLGNNRASVTFLNTGLPAPPKSGGYGKPDSSVFVNKIGPIGIVAGDVNINNSVVGNESGDVRIVALGKSKQEVSFVGLLPEAYGTLSIIKGGKLVSSTTGSSPSGSILVSAGDVTVDQLGATSPSIIASQPESTSTGNAGSIVINATGDLNVLNGATINVSTSSSGDAGSISLKAGNITINGNNIETLVQSETSNRPNQTGSGDAGSILISTPGTLTLKSGGQLNTSTSGSGDAGSVSITAGKINIDPLGSALSTGVLVNAQQGSQGSGGTIDIVSAGLLNIGANGRIVANTFSSGNAGAVKVKAGELAVSGSWIASSAYSTGNAGSVQIVAGSATLDGLGGKTGGLGILSEALGAGNAGTVDIAVTGKLDIKNNASINTSTAAGGQAGSVRVLAGSASIDGGGNCCNTGIQSSAMPKSSGDAGDLDITVTGGLTVANSGAISSTASGSGNAGTIKLTTGDLSLLSGGQLTSATYSAKGFAGAVTVNTGTLLIDGMKNGAASTISASAGQGSSGQTGTVSVTASGAAILSNGGTMSVQNDAQVANPASLNSTTLSLTAGSITADGAQITASTARNVPASDIKIKSSGNILLKNGAQIKGSTTGSGDAGLIDVSAAGDLMLSNGAAINGNTSLSGNAAAVNVTAANITLDGNGMPTAIVTGTVPTDLVHISDATGNGGSVVVTTPGVMKLLNGGQIQSSSATLGNAGSVTVNAASIVVDNQNGGNILGGIYSTANNQGNGGSIQVKVSGDVTVKNQGQISATTYAAGNAGAVSVEAGSLTVSGNGWISSDTTGAGKAGKITVKAGSIALEGGGKISSAAANLGTGDAGSIAVTTTGNLTVDGNGTMITTETRTTSTGDAGGVVVEVAKDLKVLRGGQISSATSTPSGSAGSVTINAETLLVDGTQNGRASIISASAAAGSSGQTGTVTVTSTGPATLSGGGTLSVQNDATVAKPASLNLTTLSLTAASLTADGAQITASTSGNVAASDIMIKATGDIMIKNKTVVRGETTGPGDAGLIDVSATGNLVLTNGSAINGNTSLSGRAAAVTVSAANITLDGSDAPAAILTSTVAGDKAYLAQATGKGGEVVVTTPGALILRNGGQIQSSSATLGDAGSVTVNAGSVTVDNQKGGNNQGGIYSTASGQGNSGSIKVKASGDITLMNQGQINATAFDKGNAGVVDVEAAKLIVTTSGWISSDTLGAGKAGRVTVKAAEISLDSGGKISSTADKAATGDAGSITVTATGSLTLGAGTAITTATQTSSTGDAGSVAVNVAKDLLVVQGGQISSATSTPQGAAGSVKINTGTLRVEGALNGRASSISASAAAGSLGQTGSIEVTAAETITLSNGGKLSVQNDAFVANPGGLPLSSLQVSATNITLQDAQITTASTGNIPASRIRVAFSERLALDPSSITTSANLGNGGAIDILGGKMLVLDNSQITTSVAGMAGNGGNINVSTDTLLMLTGFIQANTAARNASGGDVSISAQNLVTSGNVLFLGGQTSYSFTPYTFGFNVIQAAAPTGLSGAIRLTSPALDVSASLIGLNAKLIDTGGMGRSPCQSTGGSSLVQTGRGGLPASALGLLGPQPVAAPDKVAASWWVSQPLQISSAWKCL